MSEYPAHAVCCPYGNHPIFVRPNGSIVAHWADNEMRQRCKGSEETYCDCHLHTQRVRDLCQRVNNPEAFYAAKDAELAEPYIQPNTVDVLAVGDTRRYTKDRAEAIVRNLSLPGTYIACGDHYYACVRGDEECPACARLDAEKVLRLRYQEIVYAVCNDLDMYLCNSSARARLLATKEDVIPALRRALRAFGYVPAEQNISVPPPTDMSREAKIKTKASDTPDSLPEL